MNTQIHNWLEVGSPITEGYQLLLPMIRSNALVRILNKQLPYQEQIIKTALAHRSGYTLPEKLSFRQEFPFLNKQDCPLEMKILAANKLTAYHNFRDAHRQLFNCTTAEQQFLTAKKLTENFVDNQLIWKELNHYKQSNTILGRHPVFKEINHIKALRKLSPIDLIQRKAKIEHNIWRTGSEIAKNSKPHLQVEREKRLLMYQSELAEIERLIESYR